MHVFIPSFGRPDSQPTYELFHNLVATTVVVPNKASAPAGVRYIIRPDKNVGQARQNILNIAREMGEPRIMILDDDMKFFRRRNVVDGNDKFIATTKPRDIERLLTTVDRLLNRYAHGGITQRFMAQHTTPPHEENRRYLRSACFNLEAIEAPFPKYRLSVHEDIDMQLQLAARGLPSFLITNFAVDDHGQYAPGGCSRSRTPEVERAEFEKLHKFHPKYTSFVANSATGIARTRVAWARAYKEGAAK